MKPVRLALLVACFSLGPLVVVAACTGADGTTPDGGANTCAPRADSGDPCSGDSTAFVYSPPLPLETDAAVEAGADGGAPEDFFTDEACRAFVDRETQGLIARDPSSRTPILTAPQDGATLSRAVWPVFTWAKGPGARLGPAERVIDWLEPSAWAHGFTTGDAYVLEFTQGCSEFLRVMTESTSWTPDAASWALLEAAKGPITATIVWAKYVQNDVATGTTPVAGKSVTFSIAP